jgi:hypothetical protein
VGAFEVDGGFEEFAADGAGEVFVEFGVVVEGEGEGGYLAFGEEVEHLQGLVLDYVLFVFVHADLGKG